MVILGDFPERFFNEAQIEVWMRIFNFLELRGSFLC